VRRLAAVIVCATTCVFCAAASAAPGSISTTPPRPSAVAVANRTARAPSPVSASSIPQVSRKLSEKEVLTIAKAVPKVRALRAKYPTRLVEVSESPNSSTVLYFAFKRPHRLIGEVTIDNHTGRVLEEWTGLQLWEMARGVPGAYGNHVNALYIWLPLCVLFMLPFFNFRRPLSLLHFDLLVLLSFSVSLAFFNHARIYASVPLVYPPLIYLLARMLALMRPGNARGQERPLRLLVPAPWLALGVVLLIGFRIALNVTDSNLVDVGYASVIGADRIVNSKPLYGAYPAENKRLGIERLDAYGPVIYEAYVPFEQVFGADTTSPDLSDLSAARAAAIVFDLLAVALLFLLGRRVRGPALGVALAYAWVSYPFTLFALENNSNDVLVAVLVLAALLAATYRSRVAGATRGAFAALAGLTKLAPLALAPLLATHGLRELPPARRRYALALFLAGFLGTVALAFIPALSHDSLHTIYERTFANAANRDTPFSVWGLYGGLGGLQLAVQIATVVLALTLAIVPRRPDLVGLAAGCAAVFVATQLGVGFWFYLYIPWFFPLVMLALLGGFSAPASAPTVAESSSPATLAQVA